MASTEAQKRASAKWNAKATKAYTIRFNIETEADMIEWLESQPNKSKSIKDLVRRVKK